MTQMSMPWTSRIWLVVRSMTPQKIALCSVIRKQAKVTPKIMAKYLLLSPVSIFKAIQVMETSGAAVQIVGRSSLLYTAARGKQLSSQFIHAARSGEGNALAQTAGPGITEDSGNRVSAEAKKPSATRSSSSQLCRNHPRKPEVVTVPHEPG